MSLKQFTSILQILNYRLGEFCATCHACYNAKHLIKKLYKILTMIEREVTFSDSRILKIILSIYENSRN